MIPGLGRSSGGGNATHSGVFFFFFTLQYCIGFAIHQHFYLDKLISLSGFVHVLIDPVQKVKRTPELHAADNFL